MVGVDAEHGLGVLEFMDDANYVSLGSPMSPYRRDNDGPWPGGRHGA